MLINGIFRWISYQYALITFTISCNLIIVYVDQITSTEIMCKMKSKGASTQLHDCMIVHVLATSGNKKCVGPRDYMANVDDIKLAQ